METVVFSSGTFVVDESIQRIVVDNITYDEVAIRQAIYSFFGHSFIQSLDIELPSSASISMIADIYRVSRSGSGDALLEYSENFEVLTNPVLGGVFIRR